MESRVASYTRVGALAGSFAHSVRAGNVPVALCVGEPAVAKAVKATRKATIFLRESGFFAKDEALCIVPVESTMQDDATKTAFRLRIERMRHASDE